MNDQRTTSYVLTQDALALRAAAMVRAARFAASITIEQGDRLADHVPLTETEIALILLEDPRKPQRSLPEVGSPLSGCYQVNGSEEDATRAALVALFEAVNSDDRPALAEAMARAQAVLFGTNQHARADAPRSG